MDIKTAAETSFEDSSIEELRGYCDRMGIEYPKNATKITLRKQLLTVLGEYRENYAGADNQPDGAIPTGDLTALGLTRLNLRSQGKWGGRRRTIQLHRSMDHQSQFPQFMAWGRLHCYIPFGTVADIPYPIYNILLDTAGQRLVRKKRTDDDGRIFYKESWVPTQRFMYTDFGVTEGTEHLPTGIINMVTMLHGLTDGFKGYSERQYRALCDRLSIQIKEDWTEADMRGAVLNRCGLSVGRIDLSQAEIIAGAA